MSLSKIFLKIKTCLVIAVLSLGTNLAWAVPPSPAPPTQNPPGGSPPPTPLPPEVVRKNAETEQIKAQINALDHELEIATEAYNWAKVQLDKTQAQLEETRRELEEAQEEYTYQKNIFKERVSQIYKNGETEILEILLDTKDFSDFIARLHLILTITQEDADLTKNLRYQKEEIEKIEKEQEVLRQAQLEVTTTLDQKRIEIEKKLAERSLLLENIDAEIRAVLNQERTLDSAEQRALLEKIFKNAKELNLNVQPGTIVHTALQYLGVPYLWGGASPVTGFDCSGFTMYVFAQHGVKLPHYSRSQFAGGTPVSVEELQVGDLVFFGDPIHHVGMYIGAGYFIHSPKTGDFVKISRLSGYPHYTGARRYPIRNKY